MTTQPRAPSALNEAGKRKWKELLPQLADWQRGTLDLLTCYCSAWSSWLSADNDQDRIRWLRAIRQLSGELKLSPKSRSGRKPADGDVDPVLKLLRKTE